MYHSNSRSASPGVGAHKPFTPAPAGMASQTRTSAWTGGRVHARGRERERNARNPLHRLEIAKQISPFALNPTAMGGGCLASLPLGPLKRGWPTRVGSPNTAKCPLFFLLERRNKRVWWVRRTNDRARSAQRSSVHACLGGSVGALAPPAGPGRAINALLGKRHHEVEKRGHVGARVSTWRRGLLALVSVNGGREVTFRCRISTNGLPPGGAWLVRGLIHLIHLA